MRNLHHVLFAELGLGIAEHLAVPFVHQEPLAIEADLGDADGRLREDLLKGFCAFTEARMRDSMSGGCCAHMTPGAQWAHCDLRTSVEVKRGGGTPLKNLWTRRVYP